MPRVFVKELKDGDSVNEIFLLADKQLRANRNANLYLLATLRDRTGVVSGLMWNVVEETVQHISAGDYVRVRGKVQLYQGGLQMIVTHIDQVPETSLDPEDFQSLQVQTSGEYGGLGIEVTMEDGFVKVISPMDGTPAAAAGIKPGDFITAINGKPIMGQTLNDAVKEMRGERGTSIEITILREGVDLARQTLAGVKGAVAVDRGAGADVFDVGGAAGFFLAARVFHFFVAVVGGTQTAFLT